MQPIDDFSVAVRRDGSAATVAPAGEIDIATVDRVREQVAACTGDASRIVLDLRAVQFMDTSGLQLVFELQRRAADGAFDLVVVRGPRQLQRLMEIAGLLDRLRMIDDPADAG